MTFAEARVHSSHVHPLELNSSRKLPHRVNYEHALELAHVSTPRRDTTWASRTSCAPPVALEEALVPSLRTRRKGRRGELGGSHSYVNEQHAPRWAFTLNRVCSHHPQNVSARSTSSARALLRHLEGLASSRYTLHPHRDGTDERCRAVTARMIAMPMFVATSRHLRLLRPSLAWLGEHLERSDCLVSLCLLNVTCSRFLIAARSCHVLHVELEARVAEHAGASSVVDCEARFSRVATCREAPAYSALHALLPLSAVTWSLQPVALRFASFPAVERFEYASLSSLALTSSRPSLHARSKSALRSSSRHEATAPRRRRGPCTPP